MPTGFAGDGPTYGKRNRTKALFDQQTIDAVKEIAATAGVQPAALLAVAEVESGGRAYATVNGRREPLIRFEGHYFDRRLSGAKRTKARKAGLSSPKAGAVPNSRSQAARWAMLEKAAAIDRQAAYESVSWGLGQVMGAHWEWLGFSSVDELVDLCRRDAAGQIGLMVRYIVKAGLVGALSRRDWPRFAEGYNGKNYRRNSYDTKMADAYRSWQRLLSLDGGTGQQKKAPASSGAVSGGTLGIQQRLVAHGFPVTIDGRAGPQTTAAIKNFQRAKGLATDGIVGTATWTALSKPAEHVHEPADYELGLRPKPKPTPPAKSGGKAGIFAAIIVIGGAVWATLSGWACSIPFISNLCGG